MDDIIKEFLIESHENLDILDRDLVTLESAPSKETLAEIFRMIHTIKGASGFLALPKLEAVAHAAESLLSDLRDGKLAVIPEITTSLLRTMDAVRRILANVEANGGEGDENDEELISTLLKLRDGAVAQMKPAVVAPVVEVKKAPIEPVVEVKAPAEPVAEVKAPVEQVKAPVEAAESKGSNVLDVTVRVDVALLDRLMNLAGELVLARNQILQAPCADAGFIAASQRLNLITTDLQAGVMKARMQPIANIWGKFPRIVRDLAQSCGKQIHLEMSGEETELDRTIIESIKDPLTHILRNSVDHGIETPAERAKKGKNPEGRLFLRAFHENGQVNIEIADDGDGVNVDRVKAKAIQRGMIAADAAARMTNREAIALIFAPGFSTAETVSNISGRGVGMDVVKTNIERIGGTVECDSERGKGTTLKIKIPLTLAIIPALIVKCGGDRYAIPQVSVTELVRLDEAKSVERVHGAPVHRLRGALLPLVYLSAELQVEPGKSGAVDVVVLQTGAERLGLVVDEVCDTEEIVVKPLGKQLKGATCFAGATIMGDGSVALILDVFALALRGGLIGAAQSNAVAAVEEVAAVDKDHQTLLLFDLSEAQHMAIQLSTVARLEEFPYSAIERAGTREVVQYRGNILPLIRASAFFGGAGDTPGADEETLQAVVYTEHGRSVGLVVGRIRDIVRERVIVQDAVCHSWTLGSAVIQNRVTDLLNVPALIRASEQSFSSEIN